MEIKEVNKIIKTHINNIVKNHTVYGVDGETKVKQAKNMSLLTVGDSSLVIVIDEDEKCISIYYEINNYERTWKYKLAKYFEKQQIFTSGKYTLNENKKTATINDTVHYADEITEDTVAEIFRIFDEMVNDLKPVFNMCSGNKNIK